MSGFGKLLVSLVLILGMPASAFALSESDIARAEIEFSNGTNQQISCYNGAPGIVKNKRGKLSFKNYKILARKQNQKFKKTGNKKAKNKARKFRTLFKQGKSVCEALRGDQTPTPTPKSDPNPTPTPNQDIPTTYFDRDGNVNEFGKTRFGIPAQFEANILDGQTAFNRYCTGCHGERTRGSLAELRASTSKSPMLFSEEELPDQELADLLAYFRRFTSPFTDGLLD